ncbi:MAG: NAD(P)-dependent alcohol dehydrogenase [Acidobacteriota bacterium]|nr:NAD(P)-dependent alcohol dehydrogenase [Pyrinomonadaceae bacterium]MDW8304667.1 NAD(P)-dependent alcohol dehydrogenase [Acidobacteriota bacterium]
MKAYEINEFGIDSLRMVDRSFPKPAENQVLVKMHAVSLNYRDLMMVTGRYNPRLKTPIIPCSDGAGEVVEIGSKVTKWKRGDRVMPAFMQGWIDGDIEYKKARTALGGDLDGCLCEYAVFDETGLVEIPEHLSYEEASTLPCAALTAYNALFVSGNLKSTDTVLLQGTGGVSIFALQFAKLVGAKVIITSSSNEKLQRAKNLGADFLINYKENPDWDEKVQEITEKRGVDCIVEVGGAGTLQKSLKAVRMGGYIAVIGVLAGKGEFDPVMILMKAVRLQGIFVGSRQMFEQMNKMIETHKLKPVIDKVFEFSQAKEAFRMMESASHFGKIVVRISHDS